MDKPKLTPLEYKQKGGYMCPQCGGSTLVFGEDFEVSSLLPMAGTRDAKCSRCFATWTEHFSVTGYEDLEVSE